MTKLNGWISAARPRTLPLSIAGIIVTGALAIEAGFFSISIFILALVTTLGLQVLSNFANDYGDGVKGTDNHERVGPKRAIQSGEITPEKMFSAIKINILITIGLALLLILSAFGAKHFLLGIMF